jgi:hypothetical protein
MVCLRFPVFLAASASQRAQPGGDSSRNMVLLSHVTSFEIRSLSRESTRQGKQKRAGGKLSGHNGKLQMSKTNPAALQFTNLEAPG